ncbi:MAG: indolepyruvate oxidoreductase subunit beta [Acidobacteria bacterium]|nr:indolepyruvate oxidoreductase subunit beta [Acidobacteriota bacterium]
MSQNGETKNIFLSGVGGQGTILAGNILGQVLLEAGYDVKKAEVHGMAQRGGDVTTHFRYGKKVYSPLIKEGDVDFLVSFELLEGLRYINWVKPGGKVIINNHRILPPAVNLGKMAYPAGMEEIFKKHFGENFWIVDGRGIAKALGNIQVANVVLIGALSRFFPSLEPEPWIDVIKSILPPRLHEINVKAFYEGRRAIKIE